MFLEREHIASTFLSLLACGAPVEAFHLHLYASDTARKELKRAKFSERFARLRTSARLRRSSEESASASRTIEAVRLWTNRRIIELLSTANIGVHVRFHGGPYGAAHGLLSAAVDVRALSMPAVFVIIP